MLRVRRAVDEPLGLLQRHEAVDDHRVELGEELPIGSTAGRHIPQGIQRLVVGLEGRGVEEDKADKRDARMRFEILDHCEERNGGGFL